MRGNPVSETKTTPKPEVTRRAFLSTQVCVPADWTDEQVKEFADRENFCGTSGGWFVRKEGDKLLEGAPERIACEERAGFVHVMLDC